jgi:hypothetical protein
MEEVQTLFQWYRHRNRGSKIYDERREKRNEGREEREERAKEE